MSTDTILLRAKLDQLQLLIGEVQQLAASVLPSSSPSALSVQSAVSSTDDDTEDEEEEEFKSTVSSSDEKDVRMDPAPITKRKRSRTSDRSAGKRTRQRVENPTLEVLDQRVSVIQDAQQALLVGRSVVLDFKRHVALRVDADDISKGGCVMVVVHVSKYASYAEACEAAHRLMCQASGDTPTNRTSLKPRYRTPPEGVALNNVPCRLLNCTPKTRPVVSLQQLLYEMRIRWRAPNEMNHTLSGLCYNIDDHSMRLETGEHVRQMIGGKRPFQASQLVLVVQKGWVKYGA